LRLTIVREHLIQNGRDSEFRVWRDPGDRDSSDEEWEQEFWRPEQQPTEALNEQIDTRNMINNTLQECDDPIPLEERLQEVVAEAFIVGDNIHNECRSSNNWNEACFPDLVDEELSLDGNDGDEGGNVELDPHPLEDDVRGLYSGAKSSTLAATILLLNLCTIHGVSNCFVDELFSILHGHILPEGNSLPRNHYAAKTLTRKLGLAYNTIHACQSGCVLFRGEHANETKCPKYDKPRYKDQERKKFPVKILRHFPIIPHLQRMYRSPTISQLLLWHSENRSDREGGDNMVRHP
jgi:hypothetical protein